MASIVQNLPTAIAKTARSTGGSDEAHHKTAPRGAFDRLLKSSRSEQAKTEPARHERVEPAQKSQPAKTLRKPASGDSDDIRPEKVEPAADSAATKKPDAPAEAPPSPSDAKADEKPVDEKAGDGKSKDGKARHDDGSPDVQLQPAVAATTTPIADQVELTEPPASAAAQSIDGINALPPTSPGGIATRSTADSESAATGGAAKSAPAAAVTAAAKNGVGSNEDSAGGESEKGTQFNGARQAQTGVANAIPQEAESTDAAGPVDAATKAKAAAVSEKVPAAAAPQVDAAALQSLLPRGENHAAVNVAGSSGTPHVAPLVDPQQFAEVNHPSIVSTVRGQLLPNGGTMQIRLDPPALGALMIQVTVRDGAIDASFETSNAEATQMLSHSLSQLKHSLETQGVSVDKLQVTQAPKTEKSEPQSAGGNDSQHQQNGTSPQDWQRQSEQQRKEMLKRMWAKLGVGDPLDLVA